MERLKTFSLMGLVVLLACGNAGSESTTATVKTDTTKNVSNEEQKTLPLDKIKLPPGFVIDIFAEVDNARSMAISPSGVIYVGNRNGDKVYAVKDTDGDFKADKKWVLASDLNMPNGVAFRDGDLYIAEVSRISKIVDVEKNLDAPGKLVTVKDDYPKETHHGWKYISFGPDGKLYVPVGAPCILTVPDLKSLQEESGTQLDLHGIRIQKRCGLRIMEEICSETKRHPAN
jgi:glucose/arabinose dehydrogenase